MTKALLLRRKDVVVGFGISLWQVRALEKAGKINGQRLHKGAHPYYLREEVERALGLNGGTNGTHGTNGGKR